MTKPSINLVQRATRLLRKARDLMNDNGAHWVQGSFKRTLHYGKNIGEHEYGYCSVGGLNEAAGRSGVDRTYAGENTAMALAICELANTILKDPKNAEIVKKSSYLKSVLNRRKKKTLSPSSSLDIGDAFSVVIAFNDSKDNDWNGVDSVFKNTAVRLERRAKAQAKREKTA